MPVTNQSHSVIARLRSGARLLGLDLGAKTIGLAISDESQTVATPLDTIRRTKFGKDAARLVELVQQREVGALILGLPLNMDGSEGPRCQSTRDFARNLAPLIDRPITFWDERLSTAAVERLLIADADLSRHRRGQVTDKMAAAFILQGFLDYLKNNAD